MLHNTRAEGGSSMSRAEILFEDRVDAGRQLAERLAPYAEERPVVFALPRGGVPVGAEVSRSLGAPLEVIVSRKLGAPEQPEFGIGAVTPDGVRVLNERAVRALGIEEDYLDRVSARESAEAARRHCRRRRPRYRCHGPRGANGSPPPAPPASRPRRPHLRTADR